MGRKARKLSHSACSMEAERGEIQPLCRLGEEQRRALAKALCRRAEEVLADYFAAHPEKWPGNL